MNVINLKIKKIKPGKENIVFFLVHNKFAFLMLVFLAIGADIFLTTSSDFRIFIILTFYIFLIRFYNLKSNVSFIFSFLFLSVMLFNFIFTKTSSTTEKAAVWVFLFFCFGIFQQWKEVE